MGKARGLGGRRNRGFESSNLFEDMNCRTKAEKKRRKTSESNSEIILAEQRRKKKIAQ